MITKPKICILISDGTNCDEDLFYAFEKAGGSPQYVHVNELRNKEKQLKDFQILALPGGFSYGDDLTSGKVLAVELMSFFRKDLQEFVDKKGFILGVCNGFQTLVRTGLLPFTTLGTMHATLTNNDSGHFECRWAKMKVEKGSKASYLNNIDYHLTVSINHGEGKFFTDKKTLKEIEEKKLVVFRYVDESGKPTQAYPANPNGALHAIAGICDPTGRILGFMPHPEKFVDKTQYPNWRRENNTPTNLQLFENIVNFVKNS